MGWTRDFLKMRTYGQGVLLVFFIAALACADGAAAPAASFKMDMVMQDWSRKLADVRHKFAEVASTMQTTAVPGALGRFASVLILHPLDTLKTRAQVVSTASRRTTTTAIYRSPGLFGGATPAIAGQIVNALLTCVGYELWKEILKDSSQLDARTRTVVCAVVGDITGHLLLAPAEVLKAQLQMRIHKDLPSAAAALVSKGLWYKGYSSMLLRDVPFRALQIVLFDEMARGYMAYKKADHLTLNEMLATGALAGASAAAITTPFDLVRSRLMLQTGEKSALSHLGSALKRDGLVRVALGSAFPRMLYIGSSTALFFVVYEACSRILSEKGLLGQFETDKYAKISKKELTHAKIA